MEISELPRSEVSKILSAINDSTGVVNVWGDPAAMPDDIVDKVKLELGSNTEFEDLTLPRGDSRDLIREVAEVISENEADSSLPVVGALSSIGIEFGIPLANLSFSFDTTQSTNPRPVNQLREAVDQYDSQNELVIVAEDVDLFSNENSEPVLVTLESVLESSGITLLTTTSMEFPELEQSIHAGGVDTEEASKFVLSHFPEVSEKNAEEIAEAVENLPLHLDVISQIELEELEDTSEFSHYITNSVESHVDTLSNQELEFLYTTCALAEIRINDINELFDYTSVEAQDILKQLQRKSIVRMVGSEGNGIYKIRSDYQSLLYSQSDRTSGAHRTAAEHYANLVLHNTVNDGDEIISSMALLRYHLSGLETDSGYPQNTDFGQETLDKFATSFCDSEETRLTFISVFSFFNYRSYDWIPVYLRSELEEIRERLHESEDSDGRLYSVLPEHMVEYEMVLDLLKSTLDALAARKPNQRSEAWYAEALEILETSESLSTVETHISDEMAVDLIVLYRLFLSYHCSLHLPDVDSEVYVADIAEELEEPGIERGAIIRLWNRTARFYNEVGLGNLILDILDKNADRVFSGSIGDSPVQSIIQSRMCSTGPLLLLAMQNIQASLASEEFATYSFIIDVWRILHSQELSYTISNYPRVDVPVEQLWLFYTCSVLQLVTPEMMSKYSRYL